MFIDILDGGPGPKPGEFIVTVGKHGRRNSAYFVKTSRAVNRRDRTKPPRFTMTVDKMTIAEVRPGARVSYMMWYPRASKRRVLLKDFLERGLKRSVA